MSWVGSATQAGEAVSAMLPPLVVDLDGTLIHTDLLHESALKLLRTRPLSALAMPLWLARGKAVLKRRIAEQVAVDVGSLPYDERLLEWLRAERARGRPLVLCTASDSIYAHRVASHLGLFDEVIASDGSVNLSGEQKAAKLVQRFGERGFDYAGNSHDDVAVWRHARRAVVVNAPESVRAEAQRLQGGLDLEREFASVAPTGVAAKLSTWLRAMRPHQWLKNLLVLLPLAGAYQLGQAALLQLGLLAFVAFGLCASSVYLLNDLMDLDSDRQHPRKRERPLASGQLSVPAGLLLAAGLLVASFAVALTVGWRFVLWLAVYYAATLAYTMWLKRRVLIDCVTLGGLYTLRVVAGGAAVGLPPTFWMLAFSMFLFLSLAFVKRHSELIVMAQLGRSDTGGRGYLASDLPLVQSLGVASGFGAVLVLALYINGDTAFRLYSRPELLWLTIPVLLYWISRMWMQSQRGHMHDDPLVFALRDRWSLACGTLFVLALWAAR